MTHKPPFEKLLIANRGEVACRIQQSCRELGIQTVVVYAETDAEALFVQQADEAVALEGTSAAETYLNVEKLLDAAARCGAQAVHPGYGFLSENAGFASAVREAGLVWIGPPAEAIDAMGNKVRARAIAQEAGVPVVPGLAEDGHSQRALLDAAKDIGLPVLIKASAGGGGKGMRLVREEAQFSDALQATRQEARSAFGDDRLILEKYIENPRHIEVQVLADGHGNAVHLFERECSIQRRYQKVVEESPAPTLGADTKEAMTQAALALVRAVNYVNAGTVEFIADGAGRFYFLEMNTRLQVEHPVSEWVTGLDLVALQLQVAAGEPLPFAQQDLSQRGHAVEVRVYAEDPSQQFAPQTGTLHVLQLAQGPGIRWDSGVIQGSRITPYYDPMLAKLIAYGPNRTTAIRRLQRALRDTVVLGVNTNIDFLQDVVAHPAFWEGQTHTDFIDTHVADWKPAQPGALDWAALAAVEVWGKTTTAEPGARAVDPWDLSEGWRNL